MGSNSERRIILASTSTYRRRLLERLGLPFACMAPGTSETSLPGEAPEALATRLSAEKALAVAREQPGAWVIGSDQVAAVGARLLGKPGNAVRAREQLRCSSGATVHFFTAVSLVRNDAVLAQCCVPTVVRFRDLSDEEIGNYVDREAPFDCAGSFRWEGLGIALFESLQSDDPTALEGLPLIATTSMLQNNGIKVLFNS